IVGVLPGIGPVGGIAILLPLAFKLSPAAALILLTALYYGTMYGGSTTSILMNVPGEASSVATTFDGYQMAQQGRAGPALAIAAVGSFIAGTLSIIALTLFSPPLAGLGLRFALPQCVALPDPARAHLVERQRLRRLVLGHHPGDRHWILHRHPAGGRGDDRVVPLLQRGEAGGAGPHHVREGRYPRSRLPGIGQQRRGS